MQAYKRYGVAKGTILTAWRLCRCNPLGMCFFLFARYFQFCIISCLWNMSALFSDTHVGGQGYDPPRWFGEEELPEE